MILPTLGVPKRGILIFEFWGVEDIENLLTELQKQAAIFSDVEFVEPRLSGERLTPIELNTQAR